MAAIAPPGPHHMDDPASRQGKAGSGLGVAGGTAAQVLTRPVQVSCPGRPVDGSVHPASPGQGLVGRVDYGVNRLGGDVAPGCLDEHTGHVGTDTPDDRRRVRQATERTCELIGPIAVRQHELRLSQAKGGTGILLAWVSSILPSLGGPSYVCAPSWASV